MAWVDELEGYSVNTQTDAHPCIISDELEALNAHTYH